MDNRNDDDLPYGPWLKGARLPTNGYDRYCTDFSKTNAWPLLTRLAHQSLSSAVPQLHTSNKPHPRSLHVNEGPSTLAISTSPLTTITLPTISTSSQPCLTHTVDQTSSSFPTPTNSSITQPISSSITHGSPLPLNKDTGAIGSSPNIFATYPPSTPTTLPIPSPKPWPCSPSPMNPTFSSLTTTATITSAFSHGITADASGKENTPPAPTIKRQCDAISMRKILKRWRGIGGQSASHSTFEVVLESMVSLDEDSIDSFDCPATVASQPRHSS
ncbi:uncharacterized protein LOC133034400 [Cannabis sativa]|uniref:uncharacterized protein LOC133034400 n=1 Tax=Cannabis sativa TaxID=3483 RepID=UPI0029CA2963|nr:uncharacterized protein LOC133034400 [Cannabis sativa]